jgi:hypothetical protein
MFREHKAKPHIIAPISIVRRLESKPLSKAASEGGKKDVKKLDLHLSFYYICNIMMF